jgi:DNA topoisomerase-1
MKNNIRNVSKYWMKRLAKGKFKWHTLSHNGVLFPENYKYHKTPLIYDGIEILLNENAEEFATIYSRYLESEYIKQTKFRNNFWSDWKKMLKNDKITDFSKCDFTQFATYLKNKKTEIKEKIDDKDSFVKKYAVAYVDGKEEKVANFMIEPPGIFIGRGNHPKLGKIKRRIYPEDVTINIGKESKIPEMQESLKNHKWNKIVHDRSVEWLASWKDTITGKTKYVWLSMHSEMRGKSDMAKFDLAQKLKKKIKKIREINEENLSSQYIKTRQIGTALYFIDKLALRVGNETGEDASDTVGVTSLRCEHIELLDNNSVKLDFLSKDSIRYKNVITVNKQVYENIKEFINNKDKDDQLFDKISSSDVNKYLQTLMKGLTAKVFRTYNASSLMEKELKSVTKKCENYEGPDKINLLLDGFNKANINVAILCNHQRAASKTFDSQMEVIQKKMHIIKKKMRSTKTKVDKKKKLKEQLNQLKAKRDIKYATKNIAVETSKVNYIDPRIIFDFIKLHNIPIEKIFSKNLIEKFKWAAGNDNSE